MLEKLREVRDQHLEYSIDDLFEHRGHVFVRLPPYHPDLNPIEEVWGVIKRKIAKANVNQTTRDVKSLILQYFSDPSPELWQMCCEKVKRNEQQYVVNQLQVGIELEVNDEEANIIEEESDEEEIEHEKSENRSDEEDSETDSEVETNGENLDQGAVGTYDPEQRQGTENFDFEKFLRGEKVYKKS